LRGEGRCKGDVRDIWRTDLPNVKSHEHWAQSQFREVRR